MAQSIRVIIRDSKQIVLQEEVFALSSLNEKGIFDILPQHTNFICLVKKTITLHRMNGQKHDMPIETGLLRISKNQVNIYLGIVPTKFSEE